MRQLSLFECSAYMNNQTVRELLDMSAKKSGLSRDDIATKMNELAVRFGVSLQSGDNGGPLSDDMLAKWLNKSEKTRHMPIHALGIFCRVVNDVSILEALLKPLGFSIIDNVGRKKLQWAEAKMSIRDQNRLIRKIEEEL